MKKVFTLIALCCVCVIGLHAQDVTIFSEDFATLTSGNSTNTSGSSSSATLASLPNFSALTAAYQAGGSVKLGTGSAIGSIVTKDLNLSVNGGNFKVKFKVKGWSTVEGTIQVSLDGGTPQTVTYSAKMADAFEEIVPLSFSGGTATSRLTFATSAKRAFLDDIEVYYGNSPSINLSPGSLNFFTNVGTLASKAVNITASNLTLPVDAVISGTGASAFSIEKTLDATGNGTIAVNYNPSESGTHTASLDISSGTATASVELSAISFAATGNDGSNSKPFTTAEVNSLLNYIETNVWVKGYISGIVKSVENLPVLETLTFVATNLALGSDVAGTTFIPVELPSGTIRTQLNLSDNPTNLGKELKVYGLIQTYFNVAGVKATSDFVLGNNTGFVNTEFNKIYAGSIANKLCIYNVEKGSSIFVFDLAGRKIAGHIAQENTIEFPVVSSGLYLVKVMSANKIETLKVLVK